MCLSLLVGSAASDAEAAASEDAVAAESRDAGFLFATFRGESSPMTEQIYFGLSRDGLAWQALNSGEPVLVSTFGEQGVRDPFLLRAASGDRFFMIATDLSIHLNPDWRRAVTRGSRAVVIWESEDLVNWSEPRRVEVAPEDAGCTWAPQAIHDDQTGNYLLYWASTTGRDNFDKHRIWAATTSDFRTFSEPFIFIERERPVIDTDIVRDPDTGRYFRFSKDEATKATLMESSDAILGEWTEVEGFSLADLQGVEGPACFRLNGGGTDDASGSDASSHSPQWCLMLDQYATGQGYKAWITTDLASGEFEVAEATRFPFRFRHGSVLPLTPKEYDRVQQAWGGNDEVDD